MTVVDQIILADQYMILIGISLFFTALTIVKRTVILELLATICWWISAAVHLIAAPSVLSILSWLWFGFGVVFFLLFWVDIFQLFVIRKDRRWSDEVL